MGKSCTLTLFKLTSRSIRRNIWWFWRKFCYARLRTMIPGKSCSSRSLRLLMIQKLCRPTWRVTTFYYLKCLVAKFDTLRLFVMGQCWVSNAKPQSVATLKIFTRRAFRTMKEESASMACRTFRAWIQKVVCCKRRSRTCRVKCLYGCIQ